MKLSAVATEAPRNIREHLLDTAEQLFGERGLACTSVREITAAAGANVAAINYYFGSREALIQALVARRMELLNTERFARLEAALSRAGAGVPDPEAILAALAAPAVRLCFEYPAFARLATQLRWDLDQAPWQDYRARQAPVAERFQAAFRAALPDLDEEEVTRRRHYVLGAIHQLWAHCPYPAEESPERLLGSFLAFYAAGLRAPAPVDASPTPAL